MKIQILGGAKIYKDNTKYTKIIQQSIKRVRKLEDDK